MIPDKVFWYEAASARRASLTSDCACDVVVVGGGMAGLMCAQALASAGQQVVLLERDFCGAGASGKSSGFITPDSELALSELISRYGKTDARALWQFVADGVALLRETIAHYDIDCDYQMQDSLYAAARVKDVAAEHQAREQLGYASTLYDRSALQTVLGSAKFCAGARYSGTFGIDGFHFCQGLAAALERAGTRIFESSPVTESGRGYVKCGQYSVTAKAVVFCTDRYLPELGFLKDQIFHIQTFLAISEPLADAEVKKIFPEKRLMVWDARMMERYFRLAGGNRLLLGGTDLWYAYARDERHAAPGSIKRLDKYFRRIFPDISLQWHSVWPGMVGVSRDLLPIAGQSQHEPSRYYIAAAAGLPWAAALGRWIAQKILEPSAHPLDAYFSPYREFPVGRTFARLLGKPLSFLLSHAFVKYFR